MKHRTTKRKALSILLAIAMIIGMLPTSLASLVTADEVKEPEVGDIVNIEGYGDLKLVWSPDLEGAENTAPTGRNFIKDKNGNMLGFITGSSTSTGYSPAFSIEDDKLVYYNDRSNGMPLIIATGGSKSCDDKGSFIPTPDKNRKYLLTFNATNAAGDAPGEFRFSPTGNSVTNGAFAAPVIDNYFERVFEWPNSAVPHKEYGTPAIGMSIPEKATVKFSNFKIYEIPPEMCSVCDNELVECICLCEKCENPNVECICCDTCGNPECTCIAKWNFNATNYPDKIPGEGIKEFNASGGTNKDSGITDILIRNHDSRYPSGTNASGEFDNTQTLKHMTITNGWLTVGGWSTDENYIYLKLNAKDKDNLILKYDMRATSTSTPATLKLQYSFDKVKWKTITDGEDDLISTRDPIGSVNEIISREEHLPVSIYGQEEVYIRWYGKSGSTSGKLEFRDIVILQSDDANPAEEESDIFTHISLAVGETPDKIGVSWFTEKGTINKAVVQLAKASDLIDGQMPENATEFEGVVGTGSSLFDTNKAVITDIEPDTAYVYRVGDGEEFSKAYTFNSQNPEEYSVIVVADPQVSSSGPTTWKGTLNMAVKRSPNTAFILNAGDHSGYTNDTTQIEGYLSPKPLRSIPMASVYGNHDHTFNDSIGEKIRYLPLMYNWPSNVREVSDSEFKGHEYYFKYGDILYINIDSNIKDIEKHREFMEEAIAYFPEAKWRIATFHHDMYGGSRHAGSYYADSSAMQKTWGPFLEEFGIDLAYNGHDHLYARSKFMSGNNEIERWQRPSIFNQDITTKDAGRHILPQGTQYMALATPGDKFYELEMNSWIAYADEQSSQPEYTIMKVKGDDIIIETYRVENAVDGIEKLVDSITLSKKANRSDLETLIPGAKELDGTDINKGWDEWQAVLVKAQGVIDNAAATDDEIHEMFMEVYDRFYDLETSTDMAPLNTLIDEVEELISTAVRGRWKDQYPRKNIDETKEVLSRAIVASEERLPRKSEISVITAELDAVFTELKNSKGTIPVPWVTLHTISASGVNTVDLMGWMDEVNEPRFFGDKKDRYDFNLTKQDFADDFDGPRTDLRHGPVTADGGRGTAESAGVPQSGYEGGNITKTHVGEWVRYELDVEQSGMYEVKLGAVNKTSEPQKVILRDTAQNELTTFTIFEDHGKKEGWGASLVKGKQLVYLTSGRNIVELYFENDGSKTKSNTGYVDGPSVDILTFELTSEEIVTLPESDPTKYYLSNPATPPLSASTTHSQRGWGITTHVDDHGTKGDIPVEIFTAATSLTLELSCKELPDGNNFQFVVMSDGADWAGIDIQTAYLTKYWDSKTRTITLPFDDPFLKTQAAALSKVRTKGAILICYYSTGWNELCVKRAYLTIPEEANPCKEGHTTTENDCTICDVCNTSLAKTCEVGSLCVTHNPEHSCFAGHTVNVENCTACDVCELTLKRSCAAAEPCVEHGGPGKVILEKTDAKIGVKYNKDASEEYLVWTGNEIHFLKESIVLDKEYEFKFTIKDINSDNVREDVTIDDFVVSVFALGGESTEYQWTCISNNGLSVIAKDGENTFVVKALTEENIKFDPSELQTFGVQFAMSDDAKAKFDDGNEVLFTVSYELSIGADEPIACPHDVCRYCEKCRSCRDDSAITDADAGCTTEGCTDAICECFILGNVSGSGEININDALDVLMYLADMKASSLIGDDVKPEALRAARITNYDKEDGKIVINDALEILMYLASMDSTQLDGTVDGKGDERKAYGVLRP